MGSGTENRDKRIFMTERSSYKNGDDNEQIRFEMD